MVRLCRKDRDGLSVRKGGDRLLMIGYVGHANLATSPLDETAFLKSLKSLKSLMITSSRYFCNLQIPGTSTSNADVPKRVRQQELKGDVLTFYWLATCRKEPNFKETGVYSNKHVFVILLLLRFGSFQGYCDQLPIYDTICTCLSA